MLAEPIQLDVDYFVSAEYPRVVAAVGLITGNQLDAADAVQDAVVGYISKPPRVPVKNIAGWVTVIASNRLGTSDRSKAAEDLAANPDLFDVDVKAAIKSLPMQQRQIVTLHYLMDQSVETIAEGLGVTTGTVKTQLHRARTVLAALLRKEDHHG